MATNRSWLRIPRRRPRAETRLVCLPHAGGGALAYRAWAADLPGDVELVAIQPPGREDRYGEPVPGTVGDLVDHVAAAVTPLLDRPWTCLGHSFGALVAYELVRVLHARGVRLPEHLIVSGSPAPDAPPPSADPDRSDEGITAWARRLGGPNAAVLDEPELLAFVLPALRADLALADAYIYRPGPALPVPLTAWCGTDDPVAAPAAAAGWSRHTTAGFRLVEFPGDHFYLHADNFRPADVLAATTQEVTR